MELSIPANTPQIVQTLMVHRQPNRENDDFIRRAIESLVKKLRDRPTELQSLFHSVTTDGKSVGCCVTIPRTLDGRLQVAGRKNCPHIMYARIWRWPDLHRNEIRSTNSCIHAFDAEPRTERICVNPYHYERATIGESFNKQFKLLKSSESNENSSESNVEIDLGNFQNNAMENMDREKSIISPSSHSDTSVTSGQSDISTKRVLFNQLKSLVECELERVALADLSSWCEITYHENNQIVGECFIAKNNTNSVIVDGFVDPSGGNRFCLGAIPNLHRSDKVEKTRLHIGRGICLDRIGNDIWLTNVSDHATFVESQHLTHVSVNGYSFNEQDEDLIEQMVDVPHKIFPGNDKISIFNFKMTVEFLLMKLYDPLITLMQHGCQVAHIPQVMRQMQDKLSSIDVEKLRRSSIFKCSFVKGWGQKQYPLRVTISDCPCWIDARGSKGFAALDTMMNPSFIRHILDILVNDRMGKLMNAIPSNKSSMSHLVKAQNISDLLPKKMEQISMDHSSDKLKSNDGDDCYRNVDEKSYHNNQSSYQLMNIYQNEKMKNNNQNHSIEENNSLNFYNQQHDNQQQQQQSSRINEQNNNLQFPISSMNPLQSFNNELFNLTNDLTTSSSASFNLFNSTSNNETHQPPSSIFSPHRSNNFSLFPGN
ncbi:hypothetical protein SNEBB_007246 [Seison nebaliae]|nr:hypothetical protein SNEBB_007246 [Seison nebaliae]